MKTLKSKCSKSEAKFTIKPKIPLGIYLEELIRCVQLFAGNYHRCITYNYIAYIYEWKYLYCVTTEDEID